MRISDRFRSARGVLAPVLAVLVLLGWAMPSGLVAKKVLALLVLPPGAVWLGLIALSAWPGLRRWPRALAILALAAHTVAGNVWLGAWMLRRLEAPYLARTDGGRFDAVCVLGGGTSATPGGEAQLGPAGDRLLVPVRLFSEGRTPLLVASGMNVTAAEGSRSLAEDTARIWREMGIPESAILRSDEPRTTREEIRAFGRMAEKNGWKRVGVCSSAWHLRRVERLCLEEKREMIPVPADFLSTSVPPVAMYAIPQARGFQYVQKALWELLGSAGG